MPYLIFVAKMMHLIYSESKQDEKPHQSNFFADFKIHTIPTKKLF